MILSLTKVWSSDTLTLQVSAWRRQSQAPWAPALQACIYQVSLDGHGVILFLRRIWRSWLWSNASCVDNQKNIPPHKSCKSTKFSVFPPCYKLLMPTVDAREGTRLVQGRECHSLALSQWLDCAYPRCFLSVMFLCSLIRIIWDMNNLKLVVLIIILLQINLNLSIPAQYLRGQTPLFMFVTWLPSTRLEQSNNK